MKKDMQLLRAMSEIRPQYIADAGERTAITNSIPASWRIGGGIAIAACIAASVFILLPGTNGVQMQSAAQPEVTEQTTTTVTELTGTAAVTTVSTETDPRVQTEPLHTEDTVSAIINPSYYPFRELFGESKPSWDTCRFEQIPYTDMLDGKSEYLAQLYDSAKYQTEYQTYQLHNGFLNFKAEPDENCEVLNILYDLPEGSYTVGVTQLWIMDDVLYADLEVYDTGNHDGNPATYVISSVYPAGKLPEIKRVNTTWTVWEDTVGNNAEAQAQSSVYQQFKESVLPLPEGYLQPYLEDQSLPMVTKGSIPIYSIPND